VQAGVTGSAPVSTQDWNASRAPDDLRRAGHPEDLDKSDHLIEKISIGIVLPTFDQDDHGYKARGDLFKPPGVPQNGCRRSHRMTHPPTLRQRRVKRCA